MFRKNRRVKVIASDLAGYVKPDRTAYGKTTLKEYGVFEGKDALIVVESSDIATIEAVQALDKELRLTYGRGIVKILNGQGLPLTATNKVNKAIKLTKPNAKVADAMREAAQNIADGLGITYDAAMDMMLAKAPKNDDADDDIDADDEELADAPTA